MMVSDIEYTTNFVKQFRQLPERIQKNAIQKESIFRQNPLHPSLRLHELNGTLRGVWSISVSINYRIILKRKPAGVILFYSIGKHDVYRNL